MISNTNNVSDVDRYIDGFPMETRKILTQLRATIVKAAPKAEEIISYKMPAYKYYGMLVYFAAYENHIGFYPTPSAIEHFKKELSTFKGAKGSVQFPLDKPIPLRLVTRMVKFRAKENLLRAETKMKK